MCKSIGLSLDRYLLTAQTSDNNIDNNYIRVLYNMLTQLVLSIDYILYVHISFRSRYSLKVQ